VATNLAVGLAQHAPGDVVLLDLDLQFGGVAGALRLVPEHSIADAARVGHTLDGGVLKVFLTAHPTGVFALCAPESLAHADDVDAPRLSHIISLLSDDFRYLVIDTAAGIDVVTLAAIELATDLVLISTTDVPCVRALRRAIDALDVAGLGSQVRHFVLNRADVKGGLGLDDIQAVTGMDVDVAIPDSRAVAMSLNLGTPILESEPKSPAGRALSELVGPLLRSSIDAATDHHETRRLTRRRRAERT
jgi:pilus assembly protein CpaE